jgi:hypothetical protein
MLFFLDSPKRHGQHHAQRKGTTQLHPLDASHKVVLKAEADIKAVLDALAVARVLANIWTFQNREI